MNVRATLVGFYCAAFLAGCAAGNGARTIPQTPAASYGRLAPASGSTIPYFSSSFTYQGQLYPYSMVGTDPRVERVTTTVTTHVVPVKLTFSSGVTLDATSLAAGVMRSPLFHAAQFPSGMTQYGDAVMRGEFWKYVSSHPSYHVLLAAAAMEPTVSITVPNDSDGHTTAKPGGPFGYVAYSWFVQTIEPQILSQLKIPPSDFTIFVTARTSVLEPTGYCCYLGYHSVFSSGAQRWTTAWASVTPKSIEPLSHEVAEWLNDPFYDNNVPAWLSPESGVCGGRQLEVGDPLTYYRIKKGGFVMQDVAFYSWFARQSPSIGYQKRYDLAGKLTSPAANCPT